MKKMKGNLWVGAAFYYYGRFMFYFGMISAVMMIGTAWHTTFAALIPVPLYILIIFTLFSVVIMIIVEHYFFTPSISAWGNNLSREQNPILEDLKPMRSSMEKQRLDLNELKMDMQDIKKILQTHNIKQ